MSRQQKQKLLYNIWHTMQFVMLLQIFTTSEEAMKGGRMMTISFVYRSDATHAVAAMRVIR